MARQGWNEEDTYRVQDSTAWGGFAGRAPTKDTPGGLANGATQDVNRYRTMGGLAGQREAYQLDYGQANADRAQAQGARNDQSTAMNLTRQAAMGNAPSRAELMGRQMISNSLDAQMAAAASARGGALAQAGAMTAARQNAAQAQQQGMNDLAALRADEMARAREAYAGQAGAMRGQDYQAAAQAAQMAQSQGQIEMGQRDLNQRAQMGYEQMGLDVNHAQQQGALERYRIDRDVEEKTNQRNYERQQKSDDRAWNAVASAVGGGFGFLSDERKKDSLGSLDRYFAPKGADAMSERDRRLGLGAGSSDWERYGSKAAGEGDPDWNRGGMTRARAEGPAEASSGPAKDQRQAPAMGGPLGGILQRIGGGYSGFRSDERVKDTYRGVALLGNADDGGELRQDGERAYFERPERQSVVPEKYRTMQAAREDAGGAAAPAGGDGGSRRGKRAVAKAPPVDLDKMAADLERSTKREWDARLAQGPAVDGRAGRADPMADANRAMSPEVYRYKPGVGEDPDRLHVGPMAQRMAADPVASTAVRRLPDGTLAVDGASADRLALAGNAANQRQIDELRAQIARLQGGR